MKFAAPEAFTHNPDEVNAFYNMRRQNLLSAKPNAAHGRWPTWRLVWQNAVAACFRAHRISTTFTNGLDHTV
jgi:hypothetical protein